MGLIDNNSPSMADPAFYDKKKKIEKKIGKKLTRDEFISEYYVADEGSTFSATGTSIFDPVLCELNYLWFSAPGDHVIDPFAGGSVRGIVAHKLGRRYTGVDLRSEQIAANIENAKEMQIVPPPQWICADSLNINKVAAGEYDFILTCPPYGSLEQYSEAAEDLSNMSDEDFDKTYTEIIKNTAAMLKDNRFASVVVGNYRDKKGHLRDLCGLTVRAFEEVGLHYYNDIIYVTPAGSLPIRAGKQFQATRKIGKTHQYMLVFVKGDPKAAAERLGEIEIPDLSEFMQEQE